jgi:hypothetical protein
VILTFVTFITIIAVPSFAFSIGIAVAIPICEQ